MYPDATIYYRCSHAQCLTLDGILLLDLCNVELMKSISMSALRKDYGGEIGRILQPSRRPRYAALDIYSGAGGLSLGLEAAGFKVVGIDCNTDCCDTYSTNLNGECINDSLTPKYDFPDADLVVGGPPCQPFSVRGNQLGRNDSRNGIPSFISAIKKIMPRVWLFENVRGMLYRNKTYFMSSMKKLESLGYRVNPVVVNCSQYGVPQNRERVVVVGHFGGYVPPEPFSESIATGEALTHMPPPTEEPTYLTSSMDAYIAAYEKASQCRRPRDLHMDRPARTLTCRNLAGHTSDMHRIKTPDGRRRTLYVQEAARLQSFPDWFEFCGSKSSVFRQIGNAVPPLFALMIGSSLRKHLEC